MSEEPTLPPRPPARAAPPPVATGRSDALVTPGRRETPAQAVNTADVVPVSPRWGVLTKFLISLVLVFLLGAVLVRFQEMIAPLVLAVILAYLLRPVVERIVSRTRLNWSLAAAIVYVLLLVIIFTLLTVAGIALFQQVQGLYGVIVELFSPEADLPGRIEAILSQPIQTPFGPFNLSEPFFIGPFGPFQPVDLERGNWEPVLNQVVNAIQPALSRTGVLISSLATGTASTLGWVFFILVVSFYLLNDLRNIGLSIERLVPEGYEYDAQRLVAELGPIWNAFLRGQITLGIVMGLVVGVTMALLDVRYAVVLGLLAGLLEFIPVIGPFIAAAVAVVIALFQPDNWLGLSPLGYAGLVLVVSILLQQIENNILVPRILGGSLNLSPVVILVGAVVAANLAGLIGLLLSAPILATLRLFGRYLYRKLFDLDPWPEPMATPRPSPEMKWARWVRRRVSTWWGRLRK